MSMNVLKAVLRLCFGALALTAIGVQLATHISHAFSVVNFFSYFTNLSNIIAAFILLAGAILGFRGDAETQRFSVVRGAAVTSMAVVGVVFALLLRDTDLGTLKPWVNTVLHYIMPAAVLVDWIAFLPQSKLGFSQIGSWLVFPIVYIVYTTIRGALTGWYPYPFLRPTAPHGYATVAAYDLAIAGIFVLFGALVVTTSRRRAFS